MLKALKGMFAGADKPAEDDDERDASGKPQVTLARALKRGWLESVKYVIDLPFFWPSNVVAIMNLDKWKALPEPVRNQLVALSADFEPRMVKHFDDEDAREWQAIGRKVAKVKFTPQENEHYLQTAYRVEWASLQARAPALIDQLRRISGN